MFNIFNKKTVKFLMLLIITALGFYIPYALGDGGTDIGTIANNVTKTISSVTKLVTAGSYVAGFGLTVGALFKFKAHKENPQGAPLSGAIIMLLVGVSLIFLPSLIQTGGSTIFGSSAKEGRDDGFETPKGT